MGISRRIAFGLVQCPTKLITTTGSLSPLSFFPLRTTLTHPSSSSSTNLIQLVTQRCQSGTPNLDEAYPSSTSSTNLIQLVTQRCQSGMPNLDEAYPSSTSSTNLIQFVSERCKSGKLDLDEAQRLFSQLLQIRPTHSICPINQLLVSLVKMKKYCTVLSLFRLMMGSSSSIQLDISTLTILINCYCQLGRVDFGFAILGDIIKRGFHPDAVTFNTLLEGLFIYDKFDEATILFNKIGDYGYPCDEFTCSIIIDNLCKGNRLKEAADIFQGMVGRGVLLDVVTYASLIHRLCASGMDERASNLFFHMLYLADSVTFSYAICKHRKIEEDTGECKIKTQIEATGVYEIMTRIGVSPDTITYNSLMYGQCILDDWSGATKLFYEMIDRGISPDIQTFHILSDFCFTGGIAEEANGIFELMVQRGENIFPYSELMDGYCLQGKMMMNI